MDQAGKARKYAADGLGRLTTVWEDPSGLDYETDYSYDALGDLMNVSQSASRPRTFSYNSLSQLTMAQNPESGHISYAYDNAGNLQTKVAPLPDQTGSNTVTTTYAYDLINRLTGKTYTNGDPAIGYTYDQPACLGLSACDNIGHRTGMTDAAGSEAWSYSVLLNTTVDQRTNGTLTKTATSVSNLDGSLASLTYPSGVVTYAPGGAGRSLSVTDTTNNYATGALYAPPGLLSSVANGASLISTFYYNKRLQPCRISAKSSGTAPTTCTDTASVGNVLDFSYNFNVRAGDNGNVTAIVNNRFPNRSQNFTYDTLNRILTATTAATHATDPTDCWGEAFVYDSPAGSRAWGNLVQINPASSAYTGCTQEGFNQSITANNQISGWCYDAAGNLLAVAACGAATYVYNAEDQMTSTAGVTYKYDGDGKRVSKSSNKVYWYGGGSDPITETDALGNVLNEYVFFGGKRIARRDSTGNVDYYIADHLGTSRIVASSAGAILDQSDFYPFGGERVIAASSGNTYKFTGKERDSESGLDDFGARYYSSSMGRFTSVDPIWVKIDRLVDPQRLNLYAYGRNNPLVFVDPDGEDVTIGRCSTGSTEHCFKQLQAGLTKDDREHVKLVTGDGKNGCDKGVSCVVVDADYKSDSKNFQVLQTLANDHSATATVDVLKPSDSFDLKTVISFDRQTGEKLGILSTPLGDPNKNTGFDGYTFFPYHKGDPGPFSPDDTTHVVVNTVSDSLAATIHHELRHVLLGDFGRSAPKAAHGQPGVDQQTKAAEDEAKKNENQ